ncbi:MAG: hypothetical protein H0T62_07565 [Parachlamydiaceae bacterium]|nr:hypothetical protein [Parachlamydiaceae bacterium]
MNNKIKPKKDFTSFVYDFSQDYYNNPKSWENKDLGTFLSAIAGWVEDMDGYYINQGQAVPEEPNWQIIADMLGAAKIYE